MAAIGIFVTEKRVRLLDACGLAVGEGDAGTVDTCVIVERNGDERMRKTRGIDRGINTPNSSGTA